ncbi:MAG: hypothetical protein ACKO2L_04510 [Planctomycetaceae bacterium]
MAGHGLDEPAGIVNFALYRLRQLKGFSGIRQFDGFWRLPRAISRNSALQSAQDAKTTQFSVFSYRLNAYIT